MVKTYKKGAGAKLSAHFRQSEFDCKGKGCCKNTLIDDGLISLLEKMREILGGKSVNINSGYRCASHNRAVGGVLSSNHPKGRAADVIVPGVPPEEVAKAAESAGFRTIILYTKKKFVHVASTDYKNFVKNTGTGKISVSTFGGGEQCPYKEPASPVRQGDKGEAVRWVQWALKKAGYTIDIDGSFGPKTRACVRTFQANSNLVTDGVAGPKTQAELKKVM